MKMKQIKAWLMLAGMAALLAGCATNGHENTNMADFDLAFPPGPQANMNY